MQATKSVAHPSLLILASLREKKESRKDAKTQKKLATASLVQQAGLRGVLGKMTITYLHEACSDDYPSFHE